MGLEKIRETVLSDARKEASYIIENARKNTAALVKDRKEEIAREVERLFKGRAGVIEDEFNRKLIHFKTVAGKQMLEKRNELLRLVFDKAKEEILGWSEAEYGAMMRRLVQDSSGGSGGMIRVHDTERVLFTSLVKDLNPERNAETAITVDEAGGLPERGGFVFITETFEVDQTLATILGDIEREMLPFIAGELFKDQREGYDTGNKE